MDARPVDVDGHPLVGEGEVRNRDEPPAGLNRELLPRGEPCALQEQEAAVFPADRQPRRALAHPELARVARRHGRSAAQVVFRFALEVGMVALTGTADAGHMREDLEAFAFRLAPDEVECIERLAVT